MTTPMAPPRPGARNTKPAQQKQAAPPPRPFRVGVQSHEEINFDQTLTQSAGTQDYQSFELPPQGFLRDVWLLFQGTASTNAATVAYAANQLDAPFNIIDTIELDDTNSKPLIGPFGGYDLYLINKYGGYMYGQDPKKFPGYAADSGAGATITINFILKLPVELVNRDALGALPNKSGTNKFRVKVRLAAITTVFATAPTNAMACRLRMVPANWWEPDEQDLKGRPLRQSPPASQTTQYWTKGNYAINAGDQRVQIQQGLGFLIRNIIFVNRTTADLRSLAQDAFFPDPATIQFEANTIFDRPKFLWQHYIYRLWNLNVAVATSDVVAATGGGGRDYCVYPLSFCDDFSLLSGAEVRRGYLATSDGSRLEFRGNQGGATNFNVLVNYVAPARGDDAAITT